MTDNQPDRHPGSARRESMQVSVAEAIQIAIELHRQQRLDEAAGLYERLLEVAPDDADLLHYAGMLKAQRGDFANAEALIRRALGRDPGYLAARNNLGNVLFRLQRLDDAEACYREVLAKVPNHADAWNNLGTICRRRGDHAQAMAAYTTAIGHDANHADAHVNLGNVLRFAGRLDEAVRHFRQALALRSDRVSLYLHLGRTLYRTGRLAEAAAVYQSWLQREPDHAIARHMFQACSGERPPERASDQFVQATFDAFAKDFDEVLGELQYKAPGLVADAVAAVLPGAARDRDVLDAGCGTGLCGPLVRDRARRLVGVDLSPAMLSLARERGCYDDLVQAELTQWLGEHPAAFDVVISADVLVYFGALGDLLRAVATTLRPGGCFVFTTERAPAGSPAFELQPHGRYAHEPECLDRDLRAAGFEPLRQDAVQLRLEGGEPVGGTLTVARRG